MAEIRDILIIHHSHTDIGYTNFQDTVFALQRDYLRRAMDLAERYADGAPGEQFKWTSETTILTENFLRHASASETDRLVALHQRGLIDFGGMFCNWTPLATTEILAQSLQVAARLRHDYGLDIRYGMNCDVNGQSWGLVELLLDAGFDGFSMAINRVMARDPQPRPIGFRWAGPSGRTLMVWHGEQYGFGQRLGVPLVQKPSGWTYDVDAAHGQVQAYIAGLTANGYPHDFVQLQITSTFMWDNGGPHEELVRFVRDWNQRGWQPRMHLVSLAQVFERLRTQNLETLSGDWTDWWSHGIASSAFETALTRQSHGRFFAARTLSAVLQGQPGPATYPRNEDDLAWRGLALYDEHTWGSHDSLNHMHSPAARGQWYRKALYAYEGEAAVARLMQHAQNNLSARLPQSGSLKVSVFNPLPWARRVPLFLPALEPSGWEAASLERSLEQSAPQSATAAQIDYGVIDLPPCGYVTVPIRLEPEVPTPTYFDAHNQTHMPQADFIPHIAPGLEPTGGVHADDWNLENRFYRLSIDSVTGAIRSLVSKGDGREWVDSSTSWRLGEYIYETNQSPNGRQEMQLQFSPPYRTPDHDRQPALAPVRASVDGVESMEFLPGVGQGRMIMRLKAPGAADLLVQIVLYDDLPWIDLIYDLNKTAVNAMESVYITFPLALRNPVARYEVAGAIVEAEAQQLSYACRDFYSVQNWVDFSDEQGGFTVATPDAPIIHLGGFTNHKYLAHMQMEQPYLIGWPINNHWFTNFQANQQGWMRFRYRLLPHEAPFDPAVAVRFGMETAIQPLIGPVWDHPAGIERRVLPFPAYLPEQGSFLDLEPGTVQLVGLKPADDGQGIIARLQEIGGQPSAYVLHFALTKVVSAQICDLLEVPQAAENLTVNAHTVSGTIGAGRLQTIRITLQG